MAENEEREENTEEGTKPAKSKNMLMIIIIVVLLLIVIIGAVTTVLLMSDEEEVVKEVKRTEQTATNRPSRSTANSNYEASRHLSDIGILYPLDTFTVNLKSDSGRRYLKVTMSLELEGEELSMELDNKSPVLRDRIIRILTSKTLEEISSKKGKQKVSNQIMDTLNSMITDGQIRGIYFTEFVIQ